MADDTSNFSGITVDSRARKYYEGWAYHSPLNGREWSKYWLVLRGNVLFICKNQRTADKRTHVGILQLSPDTEVKSVPYDKKKKHSFKFELFTSSHHQRKINIFKFEKENDRDVWKSYIMGIATGVVPRDVHLLPGQFKDVMESVGDFKNTPPPLPSGGTPRPRIPQNVGGLPRHDTYGDSGRSRGSDADSDGSGSFRSHLTTATRKNGAPNDKLQQLQSRQADLTMKTLQGDYGGDNDGFVKPQISNSEFSFGPTSSNARRDQIQRQEPQAFNHGQHRDHDRSNYRDERSHKHERDQNDNFPMNYKDQHPDDLDIDDDFFNDGHQRFSSKQEENDSDDGTLGGEVKIRPKLPADWMMGGGGEVHPQTQTQRPVSGFPNPPPFSSLQRPTKADNNVQNKNNRNQQHNGDRQYGVDRQQSSNTQYDRRNSDHRQYGGEREDSQQHRGFTPAVYDVSPKRNEQYGGNQPNWSNTSSGTLRGNEGHRNDRSGSTSSAVRSEVVSLYGDLPTGRDPDDDDEPYAHQFYMNEDKNRYWPKWFFENLTREVAESVLTLGKRYGNVLMRESVTFRKTGSYVISMRREVSGGTQIHHYEITKSSRGGFKINVDNDHSTMRCLTDVMDFFVSSAGPTAKPMKNNDLASIGLSGFSKKKQTGHRGTRGYMDSDSGFDDLSTDDHHHQHSRSRGPSASSPPPAPPMAPPLASSSSQQSHFNTIPTPPPLQQAPFQHQTMPSSTNTQQNEPVTSLRDQLKLNRQVSGGGLAIHGFVNSSIQEQAQQIAMEKQTLNTMHRDSLHSMPDDPPPSTPGSGSYEGNPFPQQPAHDPNQNLSFAAKAIGGIPSPPVFPHDFTQAVMPFMMPYLYPVPMGWATSGSQLNIAQQHSQQNILQHPVIKQHSLGGRQPSSLYSPNRQSSHMTPRSTAQRMPSNQRNSQRSSVTHDRMRSAHSCDELDRSSSTLTRERSRRAPDYPQSTNFASKQPLCRSMSDSSICDVHQSTSNIPCSCNKGIVYRDADHMVLQTPRGDVIGSGFDGDFSTNYYPRRNLQRDSKRRVTFSNKRDYVPVITDIDAINYLRQRNSRNINDTKRHSFLDEVVAVAEARGLSKNQDRSVINSNTWHSLMDSHKTKVQHKILNTSVPRNPDLYKDQPLKINTDTLESFGSSHNYLELQNYLTPVDSAQQKVGNRLWDKVIQEISLPGNIPCRPHWQRVLPSTSRTLV